MKKENILVLVLISIAFGAVMVYSYSNQGGPVLGFTAENSGSASENSGIDWKSYAEGTELAKTLNRPMFIYFHAEWCSYCKKMEATTFKDSKVMAFLNQHFVSITVDSDRENEITKQWKVRGLPTFWFAKSDVSKIDSLPGYVDEDYFLKILTYIQSGKYQTMSFNDFVKQK